MLNRTVLVGVTAAALFAVACAGGGAPEQTLATAGDPAPINEVRTAYQAAYNRGDAAALAALFADDAVSLPDHHALVAGKAAIQQYYQDLFTQYQVTIAITPADTEVAGSMAHEHGTYTINVAPKAGGEAVADDGKYVVVLKRGADGAWKIHHEIDNSNRMPPMPSAAPVSATPNRQR